MRIALKDCEREKCEKRRENLEAGKMKVKKEIYLLSDKCRGAPLRALVMINNCHFSS